jgi:recombination protein RecA
MWNEIIGNESSGKTSMIFQTIAAQQRLNPDFAVLWIASEPFVEQWAIASGCNIDNFLIIETNVMEEAYAAVIAYLDNRLADCIVIDSFPALVPRDEDEGTFDEWQVGLGARLTGKFFRKQAPASRRSITEDEVPDRPCLLLIVNQWREKIGVMFGDNRTTPGGRAKNYWFAMRVETLRDDWIKEDDVRVGITIQVHTIKNKTAPPERRAACDFLFDDNERDVTPGNYDTGKDLYSAGVYYDIIEKAERGGTHTFGELTWRSRDAVIASIREDDYLQALLRFEVMRSQGIDVDPPVKPRAPRKAPVKKAMARR